jgi:uncharacterized protein YdeI (YjbR/CyaY-like superfamily)
VLEKGGASARLPYLDAVEEALCFGWIDGIAKSLNATERAQRFTPRARRSNWTELNKERARRLIRLGLMTPAGQAVLPDLDAPFQMLPKVEEALRADDNLWNSYSQLPPLYQRVRVGYIQEQRANGEEFERRLRNFVQRTARGELFGNWTDDGRLG